jgi:peroxiredoxin family protein
MGAQTVFLVAADEPERVTRAALWAVTAASVGDRVTVLLTAPALRACRPGGPLASPVLPGFPSIDTLWADARALGARIVTCETELQLSGVSRESVSGWLDDVVPMPSFWRETAAARLVTI